MKCSLMIFIFQIEFFGAGQGRTEEIAKIVIMLEKVVTLLLCVQLEYDKLVLDSREQLGLSSEGRMNTKIIASKHFNQI